MFVVPQPALQREVSKEHGVALVITLIMLAVITFMAIAFLVLSRGQKSNVATATDQVLARLAADTALERAQMDLLAPILVSGNEFNFDLLVSTNYINPGGFTNRGAVYTSPDNVNYFYPNGNPLTGNDALQNLANLLYSPRAPVFIVTNRSTGATDFRFFNDLNRNGAFEPTGWLNVLDKFGQRIRDPNTRLPVIDHFVGDPQWIGGLEFPDRPHSANNRFVYRYCYLVAPAGKTLDINHIHNFARLPNTTMVNGDGFVRDQGAGSWELNLGAFLADLNTNIWDPATAPYYYSTNFIFPQPNSGVAFDDALSILRYRYGENPNTLPTVAGLFGGNGTSAFDNDLIDGYSAGPPMFGTWWSSIDGDAPRVARIGWSGGDNTNHFFTPEDLFDSSKFAANPVPGQPTFSDHLWEAGTNASSYDRYTFYRLLSQLGTDSSPESGKINLNYVNVNDAGLVVPNMATNFIPWNNAALFFTNAVTRLLVQAGFQPGNTPTNLLSKDSFGRLGLHIQVYPTNYYTPSVHRLLQLAANIYDATTNHHLGGFPTVLRPLCLEANLTGLAPSRTVYIVGYEEVLNRTNLTGRLLKDMTVEVPQDIVPNDLVYDVPLIIGARKGLPNFNEVAMQGIFQLTRKLQLTRKAPDAPRSSWHTNVQYILSITNAFAVETWNSYVSNYPGMIDIYASNLVSISMTNETGRMWTIPTRRVGTVLSMGTGQNLWHGWNGYQRPDLTSLVVPLRTNIVFLPDSIYRFSTSSFTTNLNTPFEQVSGFPMPHWVLAITNRLQFYMVDRLTGRILDYVHLSSLGSVRDVYQEMADPDFAFAYDGLWSTNRLWNDPVNGPPQGFVNQIAVCAVPGYGGNNVDWTSFGPYNPSEGNTKQKALNDFRRFYTGDRTFEMNQIQVPFTPTIRVSQYLTWQANDPLVHYTVGDLGYLGGGNQIIKERRSFRNLQPILKNIGQINDRYSPWGGNRLKTAGDDSGADTNMFNLMVKDSLVTGSDAWDFPTNKFPNIGWLGRVHRGTPWQTVYLKWEDIAAAPKTLNSWMDWVGNRNSADAALMAPAGDRKLLEVFTTAFNDNASLGQLSVNQTNLAAWSAVLSGVIGLQGTPNVSEFIRPTNFPWVVIPPAGAAGTNSALWQIVGNMNEIRRTNYAGSFKYVGDILSVPELTSLSPCLNLAGMTGAQQTWGISDAVYERIPQQILGLLRIEHAPRFVVYAYGQALKPAPHSIVTSGPYFGLCTNYQITAEVATKTVVRVDGAPNQPHAVVERFNLLPPD